MITSFIPGRVRIRHENFKDAATTQGIVHFLSAEKGVNSVEPNLLTGSILIHYDPEEIDPEVALAALRSFEEQAAPSTNNAAPCEPFDALTLLTNPKALEFLGLSLGFIICLSSAFLRRKGLHVYSGLSLAGLAIQHTYTHRKRIMNSLSTRPRHCG